MAANPISATLHQFQILGARAKGRRLGGGAYGTVEEYDVDGVSCAGKRIHDILAREGGEIVPGYVDECKLMAKLRHPNIVQFLGVCFPPDSVLPVLIMEKLTTDLHGLLENAPIMANSLKMSFLTDVARGLAYLHGHKPNAIIHSDLSARNVLLNSSLVAKISDLGNSRIVNLSPREVANLRFAPGASVYMPPETSEDSSRFGPSLDVFSFGHLGLFTVTQVFPETLLPQVYVDPTTQVPRRLSEVDRRGKYFVFLYQQLGGDDDLVRVIVECLDNDPHKRPTAEQLVSRLGKMSFAIQSPQDHTAKVQLMGQLKRIEDAEWRQKLDAVIRDKEAFQSQLAAEVQQREKTVGNLLAERRVLHSQLRERDESIGQLRQQLKDVHQSKNCSLIDPTNNELNLSKCATLPIASHNMQGVVVRGKVYAGGGDNARNTVYSNVYVYNTRANTWGTINNNSSSSAFASYNEHLVLVGGIVQGQVTNQLWVLGEDDRWLQPIPPMPTPRAQASAVGYGQHLIVAGGKSDGNILSIVEVYSGQQWMAADPMPRGYSVMKSAVLNGTWYLTGGNSSSGVDASVLSVSLQSLVERAAAPQRDGPSPWNRLPDAPSKCMAVAAAGGGLIIFGTYGFFSFMATTVSRKLHDVYVFFSPTKSWMSFGKLNYYLYSTCAVTLPNGDVMLCGGRAYNNDSVDTAYIVKV